ncbi:MAG: biopolymer transporter ExbD [Reichenbachiella sp.]
MGKGKDRPAAEVNSGSMADIAFLLLIFFLVTTTIANDKGIAMLLPPKPDPNQEDEIEIKMHDRNIFKILANSQDRLLVEDEPMQDVKQLRSMIKDFVLNFRKPSVDGIQLYNSLPASLRSFVNKNGKREDYSDEPGKAVVSFKADRGTSYELYISVLDEINAAYNEIYGQRVGISAEEFLLLDKKDPEQKAMYKEARKGIPRAISIAEPNKIRG